MKMALAMNASRLPTSERHRARARASRSAGWVLIALWLAASSRQGLAGDWPTFMHDVQRSGTSAEQLPVDLAPAWVFPKGLGPAAAWPAETKVDYYVEASRRSPFKTRLGFDLANHPAIANGTMFVGSSTEDTVTCADIVTGETKWRFFADGPVRMSPMVTAGFVYFGSDEGTAYCLDANTGALKWRYTPAGTNNTLVPNNGRFVSPWAIRTGVLVDGGRAYFGAGIFPGSGIHVCAVDAVTGVKAWQLTHTNKGAPQGYGLLSATRLYLPSSRSTPVYYSRSSGSYLGQYGVNNGFGTFALLSGANLFIGPASIGSWGPTGGSLVTQASESGGDAIASFDGGNALVATATNVFVLTDTAVNCLTRSTRATVWTRPTIHPYSIILAGKTLYTGGEGEVAAFDAGTGKPVGRFPVRGNAYGIAVAAGRLFVSTDTGTVHAFAASPGKAQSGMTSY